ncbi:NUDIX hydrolase [Enterovirga rhinocerotis]|uniref:ADP-ribose pyrophosphatase YjhB (NUDIX family) n=1 Tax=Enterovirga rhinocerotis TaxID=1339210 RepID=A0A4R7C7P0_9HYPH|nr:NUDIX hydrolase [Enterovirga rhinocerotis]TDR94321.1 ADP-ribose pyrophosphatase YjhB (NUDIX family) [Enterovirga rhinocerotis]
MSEDRQYPARPFLAASVAVLREDRVLLAARARPPLDHIWSLPGGLVEPGESLAEAALRELKEETGVEATLIGRLDPIEYIDRDPEGRVRHHFVICPHAATWLSGEGETSPEALAIRWALEGEIEDEPTTPGLIPILHAAFAGARR